MYAKLAQNPKTEGLTRSLCQKALALHNNRVEAAAEYLAKHGIASIAVSSDESTSIRGLFSQTTSNGMLSAQRRTDKAGTTNVNIQTGEVYVGNRLGMPVPQEITAHSDFISIFNSYVPYCTVIQNKENLYSYHIQHQDVSTSPLLPSYSLASAVQLLRGSMAARKAHHPRDGSS